GSLGRPRRGSDLVVAEDRAEPLRRRRLVVGDRGRLTGTRERLELLGEVALEPRAVLPLEGAERLDLAVELVALALELAEHLLTALGGLGVEHLGAGAGVGLEPVRLHLGLAL